MVLLRRWLLVVLVLAVVCGLTSCTGEADDPPAPAAESAAAALRTGTAPAGSAATVTEEELVALFAGAGIATYADAGAAAPEQQVTDPGTVRLLGWQVTNMRGQLASGRGYLGRDLDALTSQTGEGTPPVPISVVVAAWAKAAETPGADAARALMGDLDWEHDALDIAYPDAVLMLFVNDLAGPAAALDASPGGTASPAAFRAAPSAGVCSSVQGFVQDTFASIIDALKIEADEGVPGVLATIWNTVVEIAATAAQLALGQLLTTLTAPIQKIAGVVALLSQAGSLLVPWQVTTTVTPGGALQPGTEAQALATVDSGLPTWPEDIADCAQVVLGITLPDPGKTEGSKATWVVEDPDETIAYTATDTAVAEDRTTHFNFSTRPEDPDLASGPETVHHVALRVRVDRAAVDQLVGLIDGLLLDGLPEPVRSVVATLLGPLTSATRAKLAELASVSGPVTTVTTIRHDPPPPTPATAAPTPDDACDVGAVAGAVPDGTWSGPLTMDVVGSGAGMGGSVASTGSGTMSLTVADGKVTAGSWDLGWTSKGTLTGDGVTVKLSVNGSVQGNAKGKAKRPDLDYTYDITGSAVVTAMGITQKAPIDEKGSADQFLTVTESSCEGVVATFVPSFNSKANPAGISFGGTATWNGLPQG